MRGFLRSNTFKILLIVVLIMSGILILSITTGDRSVGSLVGFITTPMQGTGAALTESDQEKFGSMTRAELEAYCGSLSAENSGLRQQMVDYYNLQQENRQYAQALNIREQNVDLELAPAAVIARDPADVFYGFTIDIGLNGGIAEGDPAITEKGVVGVVSEVYATSARIKSILSEDVKMGALAKEFMENGVVSGGIDMAANGTVRMNYLTKESKLQQGTIITTSGAGGLFPQDLIIGKVSFLGSSQTDVSLYAVIEPYENIKTVSDVFVITNFPGKGEKQVEVDTDGEASK